MNSVVEHDCEAIIHAVDLSKLRGKKVLITGASGFLGQYIAAALAHANTAQKLGTSITCVGLRKPPALLASIVRSGAYIAYKRVDLTKPFKLQGFDYIFHAAGYGQPAKFIADPLSLVKINVDATAALLAGSPKATFIYFSSAEIYGDIPKKLLPVKEDFNGNCALNSPRSVYAESKRLGEALCGAYHGQTGVSAKIVRISHIYGPGLTFDDRRVMSEFIRKAFEDKRVSLLDTGGSIKTYGYVADATTMILHVALHGKERVYNIGGVDSISILELAKRVGTYCNVPVAAPKSSGNLKHIGADPSVVRLDLSRIRREMKRLSFTPFAEGLARTIEWTRRQK